MKYEDLTGNLKTLYDFHLNNGTITITDGTYTLQEILDKDDEWWDSNHDFIQYLYPTDEVSKFNPEAPVLTKEFVDFFKNSPGEININLYHRFRQFIINNRWLARPFNHNYLRFSRVLRNIALLVSNDLSLTCLQSYNKEFNLLTQDKVKSFYIWLDSTQAKFED